MSNVKKKNVYTSAIDVKKHGEYDLALTCPVTKQKRIVSIYCSDMVGNSPKEYITLPRSWRGDLIQTKKALCESKLSVSSGMSDLPGLLAIIIDMLPFEWSSQVYNYSTVVAGGTARGKDIKTVFDRLGFDINKFEIVCYDLTFAKTNKDGKIDLVGSNGSVTTKFDSIFYGVGYGSSSTQTPLGVNLEISKCWK